MVNKVIACLIGAVYFCAFAKGCIYKDDECPPYNIVSQHDEYEIRSYPSTVWITTSMDGESCRWASYKLFMRLFKYISGNNARVQKINMTVPVTTLIRDLGDGHKNFEMRFYVPSSIQNDPPQPNDDTITIRREGPTTFAVRSFSGYVVRQSTWKSEAEKLVEIFKDDPSVDTSQYYIVGYDSPMTLFDRRNEIWMKKQNQ